jgi:Uma2 family endonuclease
MQNLVEVSQYEQERGKPTPSKLHGYVQTKLLVNLDNTYSQQYSFFSELSLKLSTWESVPDICVFPKMQMSYSEDEIKVIEAPLCVIYIIQSLQDLLIKAKQYFTYGVKSFWLVIPSLKNIYVFSSPSEYQIFRDTEILSDPMIGVTRQRSVTSIKELFCFNDKDYLCF